MIYFSSGPAGLSAARELARRGSEVTVFERRAEAGGALRHALSPIRISHDMVDDEVDRIKRMGVKFVCNADVTDLASLTSGFDGVFVSPGLQVSRKVDIKDSDKAPHWDKEGVVGALEFLESANSRVPDKATAAVIGQRVVIIGGGSVAMDCAITARALGATAVDIVAMESILGLPADVDEIELARGAGAVFHSESVVSGVGSDNTVFLQHLTEGGPSAAHSSTLDATTIIVAAGQLLDEAGRKLVDGDAAQGVVVKRVSDPAWSGEASPQGQFIVSGGDAVRGGGDTVVRAVADGKRAAELMMPGHAAPPRPSVSLETEYVGISFMNPFTLSSSPVTNSADMIARAYDAGFAGAYYKTLNREDQFAISHPSPRLNAVHGHKGTNMDVGIQNVEQISDRPLADNLKVSHTHSHSHTNI
jgi:dihydropyrimidine dehydrogenase (NAD+) subunit PreT